MTTNPTSIVSGFFYYMWNAWDENECRQIFGHMHSHLWSKWCSLARKDIRGAVELFYAELSDENRRRLVERADALYDGARKKSAQANDDTSETLRRLFVAMEQLYQSICQKVSLSGGVLYTYDPACEVIYSTEYLSNSCDEIAERIIKGLRVKDGDLQIYSVVSKSIMVLEEDLTDPELEHEWLSMKNNYEVMYNPTLLNIALNIDQYIKKS